MDFLSSQLSFLVWSTGFSLLHVLPATEHPSILASMAEGRENQVSDDCRDFSDAPVGMK